MWPKPSRCRRCRAGWSVFAVCARCQERAAWWAEPAPDGRGGWKLWAMAGTVLALAAAVGVLAPMVVRALR